MGSHPNQSKKNDEAANKMETTKMFPLLLVVVCAIISFTNAQIINLDCPLGCPINLGCPCEEEVFEVKVDVDPLKSPRTRTKTGVMNVFRNVYTSPSAFMKKQGMDLKSAVDEAHFINVNEPCYRGVIQGGEFQFPEGNGLATVAFRLTAKDDTLKATVCHCATNNELGNSVCQKGGMLHKNLEERLDLVKKKLEGSERGASEWYTCVARYGHHLCPL